MQYVSKYHIIILYEFNTSAYSGLQKRDYYGKIGQHGRYVNRDVPCNLPGSASLKYNLNMRNDHIEKT